MKVAIERRRDGSPPPQLTEEIMGPVRDAAKKIWPGVPIAPLMTAGATDGRFLMNAGIPTYGMSGMFSTSGETNAHGLNEKIRVKSLYEGPAISSRLCVRAYVKSARLIRPFGVRLDLKRGRMAAGHSPDGPALLFTPFASLIRAPPRMPCSA